MNEIFDEISWLASGLWMPMNEERECVREIILNVNSIRRIVSLLIL